MNDYREIENLLYVYAERIDAGNLEGAADLFRFASIRAEDKDIEGYDGALAMFRRFVRIYENGTPRTQHLITNARIELDATAGTASARSRYTVLQATDQLPLQAIIAGHYDDRFSRSDQGWHFTHRTYSAVLYGDVSAHLLVGVPGR